MKNKTQLRNMVAMVTPAYASLTCTFSVRPGDGQRYTYKATKQLAESLKRGDRVVVQKAGKPGQFAVVTVVEVHGQAFLEEPDSLEYVWAFQRVDEDSLERLQEREDELVDRLDQAQRRAAQTKVMEALGLDEESKALLLETDDLEGEVIDTEKGEG